jgi:mediator of RNA polymerase II transcription subunit 23
MTVIWLQETSVFCRNHHCFGNNLNIDHFRYTVIPANQIHMWINSVGLIMAALPDSYWSVLHDRLVEVITSPQLTQWKYRNTPFQLFNFAATHDSLLENKFSYTLALAHSMWHHAGVGQISTVPQ